MTKYDFYYKINLETGEVFSEYNKGCEQKGYIEIFVNRSLQENLINMITNDIKLLGKNVQAVKAAEYLIKLFNSTQQKYSCTRTKLGKLLAIVAFRYARQGIKIFDENVYKYGDCGAIVGGLTLLEREYFMQPSYNDNCQRIQGGIDSIDDSFNPIDIPEDLKQELFSVFLEFGAYTPGALGKDINPLLDYENIVESDGLVNISKLISITALDLKLRNIASPVVDYLFSVESDGDEYNE